MESTLNPGTKEVRLGFENLTIKERGTFLTKCTKALKRIRFIGTDYIVQNIPYSELEIANSGWVLSGTIIGVDEHTTQCFLYLSNIWDQEIREQIVYYIDRQTMKYKVHSITDDIFLLKSFVEMLDWYTTSECVRIEFNWR